MSCLGKVVSSSFLLCLWLFLTTVTAKECDKAKCPGPLQFYEDLNCKPVYDKSDDCCASRYDCTHLAKRSKDKCYANGHEYEVGQLLKKEDQLNPCDVGCYCLKSQNEPARFACAIVDCFPKEAKPGCHLRRSLDSCCGIEEICPEKPEDRAKCEVDGKTYLDGERFFSTKSKNTLCQCMEGYEGKDVAPFCKKWSCGLEMRRPSVYHQNCAPIYEINRSPHNTCASLFRCPNAYDSVIHPEDEEDPDEQDHNLCKFGDLKMHIGDELNHSAHYTSQCVQCTCQVPPTPTCRRLTDEECNAKYPNRLQD